MCILYHLSYFLLGYTVVYCIHPNVGLHSYQIISKHGYSYEKHIVQTQDGYILEVIRLVPPIPNNTNITMEQPMQPIILLHGTLSTPENFLIQEPDKALAFYLLRNGFDVWIPFLRGVRFSRSHVTLDPDLDAEFWDFSIHELAVYDLPATMDYVLEYTGFDKVSLLGHSQGGTMLLAMAAELPEYNNKTNICISLAGAGIMHNLPGFLTSVVASYERFLWEILNRLQIYELLPTSKIIADVAKILADPILGFRSNFEYILKISYFLTTYNIDMDLLPAIFSFYPGGCSTKQVFQYMQIVNTGEFKPLDYYNQTKNMEKYGVSTPKIYDLKKITAKFVLYYSPYDNLVSTQDTKLMAKQMKNAITRVINVPHFGHADFILARDVVNLVFDDVLGYLKNA